jgi:hypothetical protein
VTQSGGGGDVAGTSAAYYLAAHVGPGFAESHAQRTIFVGTIPDVTASDVFDVPKFAKIATLVGTTGGPVPITTTGFIRFFQSPDGTNGVGDFPVMGQNHVEVPNAAQYFSVFNASGQPMRLSVIFELSL